MDTKLVKCMQPLDPCSFLLNEILVDLCGMSYFEGDSELFFGNTLRIIHYLDKSDRHRMSTKVRN